MQKARSWLAGHDVQFYQNDAFLVDSVARFLAEGAQIGQPIIVIATAKHRRAFEDALLARGVDVPELGRKNDAVFADAHETLNAFMQGGRPDRELFDATVGSVFERALKDRRYVIVRAYGEMVDLLWSEGKAAAALELEDIWNAFAKKHAFSLLCAYAASSLQRSSAGASLADICARHSHVLPSELVSVESLPRVTTS
jgi:hypothetical protein